MANQPAQTDQITADKMVEIVYGWVKKGAEQRRIQAYLNDKNWTTEMVLSACSDVERAVAVHAAELDERANQVELTQRVEHDHYQAALERQQGLRVAGQELVEMAQGVIVFFRPKPEEGTQPAVATPKPSLAQRAVDFFKQPSPKPLSPIDQLPPISGVQLPPADDVYQEITPILDPDDPSVEAAREWNEIRKIAEEDGTGPEQELANVGRKYEELLPYWERAQLMGSRQVEQSRGMLTALAAHWSRVQEAISKQQAATNERRAQLSGYQEACTRIREALKSPSS